MQASRSVGLVLILHTEQLFCGTGLSTCSKLHLLHYCTALLKCVSICGCEEKTRFLVYAVWTAYGKKWFLTKPGKDPVWRRGIVDNKKYRIGLREVKVENGNTVCYIPINEPQDGQTAGGEEEKINKDVEDAVNHCDYYRFVTLANISQLYGKVDI